MKLLGWTWMHCKSQKSVDESLKSFATGDPSFKEQSYCPKRSYSLTPPRQSEKKNLVRKSFAGFDTVRVEDVLEEDPSAAIFDLFHGLLAVGTLGSEKLITEPATPTFGVSDEYKSKKETEVADNDFTSMSSKPEEDLNEEDIEGMNGKTSVCNNHNIINYEGKQMNEADTNPNNIFVHLQGTMESPIHSLKTTKTKVHGTSLHELMQSEMQDSTKKHEIKENMAATKKEMSVKHLVKILKRRLVNTSFSRSTNAATNANSVSPKKKFHKIQQIFDRKVHPEISIAISKSKKSDRYEIKNKMHCYEGYGNKYHILPVPNEDIMKTPQKTVNEQIWHYKTNLKVPPFAPGSCTSNRNSGYWIKTDAEYLVLEL